MVMVIEPGGSALQIFKKIPNMLVVAKLGRGDCAGIKGALKEN